MTQSQNFSLILKRTTQLLLLAFSVMLADTTGKISGTITDAADGTPLPGVNVYISEQNIGAITNGDGFYSILNIPPGNHTVSAGFIGYKTRTVQGVGVNSDQTTRLNFAMETSVLEGEEVIVTAEKPLVQADLTSTRSTITSDDIKALPNESFQSLLATKAGVTAGADGALHIRGGRASEVLYMVDGIAVTNPFDGSLGLSISTNMISELTLVSGTFNAEYGKAMSGIVNIITKDGGSDYKGDIRFQTGDMYSGNTHIFDDVSEFTPTNFNRTDLSLSGPVPLIGRATFMMTATINDNGGWLYGLREHNTWDYALLSSGADPTVVLTGDSVRVAMNPNESINVMGKLTIRPWGSAKLTYQFTGRKGTSQRYIQSYKFNPNGRTILESQNRLHALHFSQTLSDKTYFTLKIADKFASAESYVHKVEFPYTINEAGFGLGGTDVDINDDGLITEITIPSWEYLSENGGYLPNDMWYEIKNVSQEYVDENAGWYDITAWNDDSTVNIAVPQYVPSIYRDQARTSVPADHFIYGSQMSGYNLSDHDTKTIKFDFTSQVHPGHQIRFGVEANRYTVHSNGMAVLLLENRNYQPYIAPTDNPGTAHDEYTRMPFDYAAYFQDKIELENVIIQAGLRFDYFDANDSTFSNKEDPVYDSKVKPKTQLSPRLGVSFPITDQGFIRFSYGHFFKMPGFSFLYRNPDLKRPPGSFLRYGNADIEPERTVMYELGLQQQISSTTAIDATIFYRNILNWLSSEYNFINNDMRYTRYITQDYGNVRGITLALIQRTRTGLALNLDYTFEWAEGNSSSPDAAFYDAQANRESEKKVVPLDWDVRSTANATVSYKTRGGTGLSIIAKFATGLPYSPTTTQGLRNSEENGGRKLVHFTSDFQAYKNIAIGSQSLQLTFKVYNLFDRLNEQFVFTDTGRSTYSLRPTYAGDPAEIYPTLAGKGVHSLAERLYSPTNYSNPRQILMSLGWSF